MDPKKLVTAAADLTDDLVVEILSRLPYNSFCRFKCVCRTWFGFSFDPHYCQKLPKIPTGFLYQGSDSSAIQLVSLSGNDKETDGTLSFVPHYEHLELLDCCNGLVLCKYKSSYTSPDICRFIVCNPVTREWRMLPDTQHRPDDSSYIAMLAFDPSWSPQFYVFNFEEKCLQGMIFGVRKLEVFSSALSTWLVDDAWSSEIPVSYRPHIYTNGVFYVQTTESKMLVFRGLEEMSVGAPPSHQTDMLPLEGSFVANFTRGRFSQYFGDLHYALPEVDGQTILVWSAAYPVCRVSMRDAFGREDFIEYDTGLWSCNYQIVALDLDRDILFLFDEKSNKLVSYNMSTRRLNEIQECPYWVDYEYYVACYSKLPAL